MALMSNTNDMTKTQATKAATEFAASFALEAFARFPGRFSSAEVLNAAARAGAAFAMGATSADVATVARLGD